MSAAAIALSPCPYCNAAPKYDENFFRQHGDGWTRISCWNDDCEQMPTTGWFRDDKLTGDDARRTWDLIAARDVRLHRDSLNGVFRLPEIAE